MKSYGPRGLRSLGKRVDLVEKFWNGGTGVGRSPPDPVSLVFKNHEQSSDVQTSEDGRMNFEPQPVPTVTSPNTNTPLTHEKFPV